MLARKIILGFGFAILMPMLIHYGIDVFSPRYDRTEYYKKIEELEDAEEDASDREDAQAEARVRARRRELERTQRFQSDQSERIHFFVGAPLGIIVTLMGSFIRAQAIGGGLMLGGIFTFTYGCFYYWPDLSRQGRFLVLLVAFGVLLWIGYQRLSELKQPTKSS